MARGEFQFPDDARAGRAGPPKGIERQRHARADHHHVRAAQRRVIVPGAMDLHCSHSQSAQRGRQLRGRLLICHGHARAQALEQADRSQAAPSQPNDGDPLPGDFQCRLFAHHHTHRSFNVLKLTRASSMAMIHRRTTTLGSSQPFSSKW